MERKEIKILIDFFMHSVLRCIFTSC